MLTVGWLTFGSRAACEKLPLWTTRTNTRTASNLSTTFIPQKNRRHNGFGSYVFIPTRCRSSLADKATADTSINSRQGRAFIVGNTLTFADIDIAGPCSQVDRAKFPFKEFPNLIAWHDSLLQSSPAWAETKADVDNRMETFLASMGVKL
ncbi:glutathione binding-like protein [Paraburkholderia rhynchosiae]|uniref:Glutathione S-transferase C-terminal domain-containing protein n=1 Tax=Paraburkholderia rhynchosiae TaxID=487049 RepID=A0ABX4UUY7_9BURK|nr:glutathione binding-like protein [Paraburkholderia rhynchosiae]PMS21092.1 hypothetical protein C0Z16_34100 [Paraburkholderia rhynchosiae]